MIIFNIIFLLIGIVGLVILFAITKNQKITAKNQVKQYEILKEILKETIISQ